MEMQYVRLFERGPTTMTMVVFAQMLLHYTRIYKQDAC